MISMCVVWIVLGEPAASSQAGVIATDTSLGRIEWTRTCTVLATMMTRAV